MGKKIIWLLFPIATLLFAFLFIFHQPKIDYFILKPKDIKETLITVGRIEPAQRIDLAFQVQGIVEKTHFLEGDRVNKGDLLCELEMNTEKNTLEQKKASLVLARNSLDTQNKEQYLTTYEEFLQLSIEENRLKTEYEANQALFQEEAISVTQLENSRSNWEKSLSRKNALKVKLDSLDKNGSLGQEKIINIQQAQLAVEAATLQLEKKKLFSPIDGWVTSLNKESGEYVQGGETVFSLFGREVNIKGEIDEKELYRIKPGMEARVALLADQNKVYAAKVKSISSDVNPQKGTLEIYLSILDDNFPTTPYAAVNIEIITRNEKEAWALPQTLLEEEDSKEFVWIWQEGKIIKKEIAVKSLIEGWAIIDPLENITTVLEPGNYREGKKAKLGQERSE